MMITLNTSHQFPDSLVELFGINYCNDFLMYLRSYAKKGEGEWMIDESDFFQSYFFEYFPGPVFADFAVHQISEHVNEKALLLLYSLLSFFLYWAAYEETEGNGIPDWPYSYYLNDFVEAAGPKIKLFSSGLQNKVPEVRAECAYHYYLWGIVCRKNKYFNGDMEQTKAIRNSFNEVLISIRKLIADKCYLVARNAIRAFGSLQTKPDQDSKQLLLELIHRENWNFYYVEDTAYFHAGKTEVQTSAMHALKNLFGKNAMEDYESLISHPDPFVRLEAKRILRSFKR